MLSLGIEPGGALELLCLGAHGDDLEIGCGGLVAHLAERYDTRVTWVVLSGDDVRAREAAASAAELLAGATRFERVQHDFEDGLFPTRYRELREALRALRAARSPDLVLTHRLEDRHQDHRTVAELSWGAFRQSLILEYEIPKYEGDLGAPNLYLPLSEAAATRKLEHLGRHFGSQRVKPWYDAETFRAHLRLRGLECGARYAEAFYGRKLRLG